VSEGTRTGTALASTTFKVALRNQEALVGREV
jgi:hypothetical protein